MITRYTLGFIFSEDKQEVLLLKMNKPGKWNYGLVNGIGGHIEKNELFIDCMRRECKEETGTIINHWNFAGVYDGSDYIGNEFKVFTYYAVIKKAYYTPFNSPEGDLSWYKVNDIMKLSSVPNMKWMIPFCLDRINGDIHSVFNIKYCNPK